MSKYRPRMLMLVPALTLFMGMALAPRQAAALVIQLPSSGTAIAGQIAGNQWVAFQPAAGGACNFWFLGNTEVTEDFRILGTSGTDWIWAATSNTNLCGFPVQPLVQGERWMIVFARPGADFVMGGIGPSQVLGEDGNDVMVTGFHMTAYATGDSGNDFLWGNQSWSRLIGGSNDDKLCAWSSSAVIFDMEGGSGFDCARGTSTLVPIGIEAPCTDAQCTLF